MAISTIYLFFFHPIFDYIFRFIFCFRFRSIAPATEIPLAEKKYSMLFQYSILYHSFPGFPDAIYGYPLYFLYNDHALGQLLRILGLMGHQQHTAIFGIVFPTPMDDAILQCLIQAFKGFIQ